MLACAILFIGSIWVAVSLPDHWDSHANSQLHIALDAINQGTSHPSRLAGHPQVLGSHYPMRAVMPSLTFGSSSQTLQGLKSAVGQLRMVPPELDALAPASIPAASIFAQLQETFQAVGQVAVLAGAGFLLRRFHILDKQSTKALSKMTLAVLLPCFLLTKLAPLQIDDLLRARGLSLGLFLLISAGYLIGEVTARFLKVPERYSRSFSSSCAFGNGTSLPIIMVSSIVTSCSSLREMYSEAEAIGVLAVALPMQHILMWLVAYNYIKGSLFPPSVAKVPETIAPEDGSEEDPITEDEALMLRSGAFRSIVEQALQEEPALARESPMSFFQYNSIQPKWDAACFLKSFAELMNPPLFGIILGFLIALVEPLNSQWCETGGALQWLASSLERLGTAVVPISMMTLGSNLSEGPGEKMDVKPITSMFIVRQLIMPFAGIGLAIFLRHVGVFSEGDALPPLVLMVMASAPTANNIVNIATACSAGPGEISTCVFWQYVGFLALQVLYIPLFIAVAERL